VQAWHNPKKGKKDGDADGGEGDEDDDAEPEGMFTVEESSQEEQSDSESEFELSSDEDDDEESSDYSESSFAFLTFRTPSLSRDARTGPIAMPKKRTLVGSADRSSSCIIFSIARGPRTRMLTIFSSLERSSKNHRFSVRERILGRVHVRE
jgi:hypothetical protein